jgi:hypothetical protein
MEWSRTYAEWDKEYRTKYPSVEQIGQCRDATAETKCNAQLTKHQMACVWQANACVQNVDDIMDKLLDMKMDTIPIVPYAVMYVNFGQFSGNQTELIQTLHQWPVHVQALVFLYCRTLQQNCPTISQRTLGSLKQEEQKLFAALVTQDNESWADKRQQVLAICAQKCKRHRTSARDAPSGYPALHSAFVKRLVLLVVGLVLVTGAAAETDGLRAKELLLSGQYAVPQVSTWYQPYDDKRRVMSSFENRGRQTVEYVHNQVYEKGRYKWRLWLFGWIPGVREGDWLLGSDVHIPEYVEDFEQCTDAHETCFLRLVWQHQVSMQLQQYDTEKQNAATTKQNIVELLVGHAPLHAKMDPTKCRAVDRVQTLYKELKLHFTAYDDTVLPTVKELKQPYLDVYHYMREKWEVLRTLETHATTVAERDHALKQIGLSAEAIKTLTAERDAFRHSAEIYAAQHKAIFDYIKAVKPPTPLMEAGWYTKVNVPETPTQAAVVVLLCVLATMVATGTVLSTLKGIFSVSTRIASPADRVITRGISPSDNALPIGPECTSDHADD